MMNISQEKEGTLVILTLTGRLDTVNYPLLEKKVNELTGAGQKEILLNCTELEYVSSSGLRVLLKALKQVEALQGRLTICNMKPEIAQIFKISGFDRLFEIYPSADKAVASYH